MECPKCNAEVSGKFCRQCGSAVNQPPDDTNRVGLCPSCGASVRPGAKFCLKCAAPLTSAAGKFAAKASEKCLHCGSQLKPGSRFCKSCGKPAPLGGARPDSTRAQVEAPIAPAQSDQIPVPRSSSPEPLGTSPIPATKLPPKPETRPTIVPAPPSSVPRPVPKSVREQEARIAQPQKLPASSGGFWGNNKALLLSGVVVLALIAGGLTYRFVLRKPAANSTPVASAPAPSQPAPTAPNPPAAEPQSTVPPEPAPATESPNAPSEDQGAVSTTPVPAKPNRIPPSVPALDFSGNWHGEYTNHDTNQITKVNLQISEDSADVLTGTLLFDPGGSNSGSCSLTGVYNSQSKFLLLNVDNCRGRTPNYLQGKIGFSSVSSSDRRVFGVDSLHNCWLDISRQ